MDKCYPYSARLLLRATGSGFSHFLETSPLACCGVRRFCRRDDLNGDYPPNTRERWGWIEGISATSINQRKVKLWLKIFSWSLNDTGDILLVKRNKSF
jgi:toxic protein SymE